MSVEDVSVAVEDVSVAVEDVSDAYGDTADTFWSICGCGLAVEFGLGLLGFVGTFSRTSAWSILFITLVLGFLSLFWSVCCASTKDARKTPGSWKLHRTRHVLGVFLLVIIIAGILWVVKEKSNDEGAGRIRIGRFTDSGDLTWEWKDASDSQAQGWIDHYRDNWDPMVDEWFSKYTPSDGSLDMAETVEYRMIKGEDWQSILEINHKEVPSGTKFKVMRIGTKTIRLYSLDGWKQRVTKFQALDLFLIDREDEAHKMRMIYRQDSTAMFINAIDFALDISWVFFGLLPAFVINYLCDEYCSEQLKLLTGQKLTIVALTCTTLAAVLCVFTMNHGCTGGCRFALLLFVSAIGCMGCSATSLFFNRTKYPGPISEHNGVAVLEPATYGKIFP